MRINDAILNKHNRENLDKYRYVAGKDTEKVGKEKIHIKQEQREWKRLSHKNSDLDSWVYGHNHTFIFGKVFGGAVRPWCELFGLSD